MPPITSAKNQRVKDAAKLRDRRARSKSGRFIIDGAREIARALAAGVQLVEVFVCESLCKTDECRGVLAKLSKTAADILHVTPVVFEKLAFGQRAEGIVAVAATPKKSLADLRIPADPLVVVLVDVEKPGNIGAVLRSADAAGASAVIVADAGTDLFNPNVIRASLGTIFTVPVAAADGAQVRDWLRQHRLKVFAARVDAATQYTKADFRSPAAIVLGSEAKGLSADWSGTGVVSIKLPMRGAADSLNVSTAAAVLLFEARRQRDQK